MAVAGRLSWDSTKTGGFLPNGSVDALESDTAVAGVCPVETDLAGGPFEPGAATFGLEIAESPLWSAAVCLS